MKEGMEGVRMATRRVRTGQTLTNRSADQIQLRDCINHKATAVTE